MTSTGFVTIMLAVLLVAGGCAATGAFGIYWDAARECEGRYRNVRVKHIDPNGDLAVSEELDVPKDFPAFSQCYRDEIGKAVLRLEQRGSPSLTQ